MIADQLPQDVKIAFSEPVEGLFADSSWPLSAGSMAS